MYLKKIRILQNISVLSLMGLVTGSLILFSFGLSVPRNLTNNIQSGVIIMKYTTNYMVEFQNFVESRIIDDFSVIIKDDDNNILGINTTNLVLFPDKAILHYNEANKALKLFKNYLPIALNTSLKGCENSYSISKELFEGMYLAYKRVDAELSILNHSIYYTFYYIPLREGSESNYSKILNNLYISVRDEYNEDQIIIKQRTQKHR